MKTTFLVLKFYHFFCLWIAKTIPTIFLKEIHYSISGPDGPSLKLQIQVYPCEFSFYTHISQTIFSILSSVSHALLMVEFV